MTTYQAEYPMDMAGAITILGVIFIVIQEITYHSDMAVNEVEEEGVEVLDMNLVLIRLTGVSLVIQKLSSTLEKCGVIMSATEEGAREWHQLVIIGLQWLHIRLLLVRQGQAHIPTALEMAL